MLHSSEIRLIDLGVTGQRGSCMEPPVEDAQAFTDVIRMEIPKKPTQIWHLNKSPMTLSSQRYPNNRWKICSHVKGLLVRSKEYLVCSSDVASNDSSCLLSVLIHPTTQNFLKVHFQNPAYPQSQCARIAAVDPPPLDRGTRRKWAGRRHMLFTLGRPGLDSRV